MNQKTHILVITGNPGVGKTTLLTKAAASLKTAGYSVGGMVSREVREGGMRVGFEVLDLATSQRGWLASVRQGAGPQVGKYRVNLPDLEAIGAKAIIDAVANADVVAIDEIGPMEFFSQQFKTATQKAFDSGKLVLAVVHWKAQDPLVKAVKNRSDAETFLVTTENRGALTQTVTAKALAFLA
jgi:nucleoside-triphosphatase